MPRVPCSSFSAPGVILVSSSKVMRCIASKSFPSTYCKIRPRSYRMADAKRTASISTISFSSRKLWTAATPCKVRDAAMSSAFAAPTVNLDHRWPTMPRPRCSLIDHADDSSLRRIDDEDLIARPGVRECSHRWNKVANVLRHWLQFNRRGDACADCSSESYRNRAVCVSPDVFPNDLSLRRVEFER